ncbi:MAG: hypothetical protein AAFP84_20940 [Actinomycetota bacterium]
MNTTITTTNDTSNHTGNNEADAVGARPRARTRRRVAVIGAGAAIALAACGSDSDATPATEPAPQATAAPAAEPAAAPAPADAAPSIAAVTAATTDLGEVLVGDRGLTLYGFTNDVDAISACYGACADAWPPLIVDADWSIAPGLDAGIFATTTRDDGSLQLVAGKWPLYYFAGDAAAGDINGQNSGDVWFAVDTAGLLVQGDGAAPAEDGAAEEAAADGADEGAVESAPAPVQVVANDLGDILADDAGLTLYGFTEDVDGNPTCEGACADAWPPLLADEVPAGLDPAVFSIVPRPDGTNQLKAGAWPLYLFAGDAAPGDTAGQGSGDVWFVVAPDGSLVGAGGAESLAPADEAGEPAESDGYDY